MKKHQVVMLGTTIAILGVLVCAEVRKQSIPEHQPGTLQIQEHQEESGQDAGEYDEEPTVTFAAIREALAAEELPCSSLEITAKSDYEIDLSVQMETALLRSYLSETEVGYNALLGLMPDSCSGTITVGLSAENGTLHAWCTGARLEGINLPEEMIPQLILEKVANSIWPAEGMQQLDSVHVGTEGIYLSGT